MYFVLFIFMWCVCALSHWFTRSASHFDCLWYQNPHLLVGHELLQLQIHTNSPSESVFDIQLYGFPDRSTLLCVFVWVCCFASISNPSSRWSITLHVTMWSSAFQNPLLCEAGWGPVQKYLTTLTFSVSCTYAAGCCLFSGLIFVIVFPCGRGVEEVPQSPGLCVFDRTFVSCSTCPQLVDLVHELDCVTPLCEIPLSF